LGISYPTTWPMHQKLNSATAQLDNALQLSGFVPAYLGGERESGKMGRGAENKFPSAAAVAVDFLRLPLCLKLNLVSGFTREASRKWAKAHLRTQTTVISDGLGCSAAVAGNGCMHLPMAVGERRPRDLRQLKWANTARGNLSPNSGLCIPFPKAQQIRRSLPCRLKLSLQSPLRSA